MSLHRVEPLEPIAVPNIDLGRWYPGSINLLRVHMMEDGMGRPIYMPAVVVRGASDGPVVAVTAAVHGNELNGMRIIHRLLRDMDPKELRGTLILSPLVNVTGFLHQQREFNDGRDLNRIMPGRPDGTSAEIYAHRLLHRFLEPCDYLIDLHTASFGRVNSLYVRANLEHPEAAWMARAQHPQIIVASDDRDGTLRAAAMDMGIHAITVEVGDPHRFQRKMIRYGSVGLDNVLSKLKMVDAPEQLPDHEPVRCTRSFWMYTDRGGILEVLPELCDVVEEGQTIARVTDIYGQVRAVYKAPMRAIVVGKSSNPVNQTGSRIAHLGVLAG